jgi:hypothetical protein
MAKLTQPVDEFCANEPAATNHHNLHAEPPRSQPIIRGVCCLNIYADSLRKALDRYTLEGLDHGVGPPSASVPGTRTAAPEDRGAGPKRSWKPRNRRQSYPWLRRWPLARILVAYLQPAANSRRVKTG